MVNFEKVVFLFQQYWPMLWRGIQTTLLISLIGTMAGLVIGFFLSQIRSTDTKSYPKWLRGPMSLFKALVVFYIEFVRGTPMIAQAVFLYYGLNPLLQWSPFSAGLIIVSLNTSAYMAEVLRAGIQSIDPGQKEAAQALGMSAKDTFRSIILPQAIRNAYPAIGNEFIVNIKDTSILNVISVTDLFAQSMSIAGSTFAYSDMMFINLFIYFVLTSTVSIILRIIEKRLNLKRQTIVSQTVPEVLV